MPATKNSDPDPDSAIHKETPAPPTYLGDGVFIKPDPVLPNYQLELFVADRGQVIYLDHHVQERLYEYLAARLGKRVD